MERVRSGENQAQIAADLGVSQAAISQTLTKAEEKERQDAERAELARAVTSDSDLPAGIAVWTGDFRELGAKIPDGSVSLIFTDPPYAEKFIPLYGDLAQLGARVLKPGGSLICYCGHYALPSIFSLMTLHLRFWWVLALEHTESKQLPGKWVNAAWKPLLWFVKDHRANNNYVRDLISTAGPEKKLHDWQQSTTEATYCIERLTEQEELILDPMAGSGTTLVAALGAGRQALGVELDPKTANIMRGRLCGHNDS